MFALAHARPEMDNGANLPQDRQPPMTTKEDDLIILGDGIAQRRKGNDDDDNDDIDDNDDDDNDDDDGSGCKPGWIHCAPGLGGGCCPSSHPVCCGNGIHCMPYGPC